MMRVWLTMGMLVVATAAIAADRCGDADGNGTVGVTDGVQVLRSAASLPSSCTPARCDANDDGAVTVTDGVNVLREVAGLAPTLTCPGAAPACESATVSVALEVPQPIGAATLTLGYPVTVVTLPGTGDAAAARVTFVNPNAVVGGGQPNDHEDRVELSLVAPDGLADGALLTIRFDCLAAAPGAPAFDCALTDVTTTDGITPVTGATCTVGVTSE